MFSGFYFLRIPICELRLQYKALRKQFKSVFHSLFATPTAFLIDEPKSFQLPHIGGFYHLATQTVFNPIHYSLDSILLLT